MHVGYSRSNRLGTNQINPQISLVYCDSLVDPLQHNTVIELHEVIVEELSVMEIIIASAQSMCSVFRLEALRQIGQFLTGSAKAQIINAK